MNGLVFNSYHLSVWDKLALKKRATGILSMLLFSIKKGELKTLHLMRPDKAVDMFAQTLSL